MAENTKIEWAHHTFNPWIGCTKVSPACDHCYAEADFGTRRKVVQWGAGQPRKHTAPSTWAQPLRWNAEAERLSVRYRVFCASLADVFDNEVPTEWRGQLWALINATPHLDWLLLTKRIGNVKTMMYDPEDPQPNVWIGATICNQAEADRDIPKLLAVPAAKRFLSMEPLLGPVSFEGMFANPRDIRDGTNMLECIDQVIVGGESGRGARPTHPDWVRSLRDQCAAAGVPFLFKQWGEWQPIDAWHPWDFRPQWGMRLDGQDVPGDEWYEDAARLKRVGKKSAGRLLDGRTWDEVPS